MSTQRTISHPQSIASATLQNQGEIATFTYHTLYPDPTLHFNHTWQWISQAHTLILAGYDGST
jgi:hypothetical protein